MPYVPDTVDLTSDQVALKHEAHGFAAEALRPASAALDAMPPDEAIATGSPP
jgi:hypothetical protein